MNRFIAYLLKLLKRQAARGTRRARQSKQIEERAIEAARRMGLDSTNERASALQSRLQKQADKLKW